MITKLSQKTVKELTAFFNQNLIEGEEGVTRDLILVRSAAGHAQLCLYLLDQHKHRLPANYDYTKLVSVNHESR